MVPAVRKEIDYQQQAVKVAKALKDSAEERDRRICCEGICNQDRFKCYQ